LFRLSWSVGCDRDRRGDEELAQAGELMRAHGVGQESVMADADEAAGQDVKEKATEEGGGVEGGESGGVAVGAALPAEGDLAVGQRDEPLIGEGDPIAIAAPVGEHPLRAGGGGLAVHDPLLPRGLLEPATGGPVRCLRKLLLAEGLFKRAQQLAAEDPREHAHGQEEVATGGEPAGVPTDLARAGCTSENGMATPTP
jgi:hypothetical protein